MGWLLYNAHGDKTSSMRWYQAAADQGSWKACIQLGHLLYDGGRDFKSDKKQALQFYQKSLEIQENAEAWNCMGLLYEEGYDRLFSLGPIGQSNFESAYGCYKKAH